MKLQENKFEFLFYFQKRLPLDCRLVGNLSIYYFKWKDWVYFVNAPKTGKIVHISSFYLNQQNEKVFKIGLQGHDFLYVMSVLTYLKLKFFQNPTTEQCFDNKNFILYYWKPNDFWIKFSVYWLLVIVIFDFQINFFIPFKVYLWMFQDF